MFLTFFLCFVLWSGITLFHRSGKSSISWQASPKLIIAYISFILSLLSVLVPDPYQPTIFASESAQYYLPVSYPLGVRFFTSQNMEMSNWRIWFLFPEFDWTFSFSGFIPFQTHLINFLISCCFFLVNYLFSLNLLKYIYTRKQIGEGIIE